MKIINGTVINGVALLVPELKKDERGSFSRVFCKDELWKSGIDFDICQINNSHNLQAGTWRGLHWLAKPSIEQKIVRVSKGAILDILLDLRPESKSYLKHMKVQLNAEDRTAVYIPPGIAHGFLTLQENTEVLYFLSAFYAPENDRGVRYNDPAFGITLPFEPRIMSERDRTFPDYKP